MDLKKKISIAAQTLVAITITAILVAACGGSSDFEQTYTSSAGAGEVLQFSVDTSKMTYIYKEIGSSYGIAIGQTGKGSLTSKNAEGSYNVGQSDDNFIQSGKVFPIKEGLLLGHLLINSIGGANKIPVFGISNPITTIARLAGTYNFQGFGCTAKSGGNVFGAFSCLSHYGTVMIVNTNATTDSFTKCKFGNFIVNASGVPCSGANQTGTISATQSATPGVFDLYNNSSDHIGWIFAFTAQNNQTVAVIDHDDAVSGEFGHTILATYASAVSGTSDGNYYVKNNMGGEYLVTISGSNISSTAHFGVNGTLTFNSPWTGLAEYQFATSGVVAASGVAMTGGTGAYTNTDNAYPALFAVGLRY